jgi:invasion protein IalB
MQPQRPTIQFAIYAIGILLGAASLPAAADSPAPAADPAAAVEPAAPAPAPAQKPKVVCKSEKVTGSSIKKRTCRTQEQAAQQQRDSQEYLNKVQGSAGVNGGGQGGL